MSLILSRVAWSALATPRERAVAGEDILAGGVGILPGHRNQGDARGSSAASSAQYAQLEMTWLHFMSATPFG
jgi:hypothetical protein